MADEWQGSQSPSPTYDFSYDYYEPDGGGDGSPMETEQDNMEEEEESQMKPSSSLQLMLSAICEERDRDDRPQQLISDGESQNALQVTLTHDDSLGYPAHILHPTF